MKLQIFFCFVLVLCFLYVYVKCENGERADDLEKIVEDHSQKKLVTDEKEQNPGETGRNNKDNSEDNWEYTDVDVESLGIFPNPEELYTFLTTENNHGHIKYLNNRIFKNLKGKLKKKEITKELFLELYKSALSKFDVDGYSFLMEKIMQKEYSQRFTQKVKNLTPSYAHCDKGMYSKNTKTKEDEGKKETKQNIEYPGGPIRSTYGNNLSKWMKDSLENIETPESIKEPGLANMVKQSLVMLKGLIQSVASSVIDIVPPLIPPPIWINRPLPCLPMVTGKNCLGSILYPITAAEFITADVSDSIMNGIISSFPSKYATKVGKTSDMQYRICAMAYLGIYCASIFPICWLPIGLRVSETMPVCFPQCLATLIACPGFWIDDIEGPCSSVSVPPFCSFSIFVNHKIVPPQLASYDESHSFPVTCPKKDEEYDTPDDLYEHEKKRNPLSKELGNYSNVSLPTYPDLVSSLHDVEQKPEDIELCKCMDIIDKCEKHFALPIIGKEHHIFKTKYETPIKLSKLQKKCCKLCKPIWKIIYPRKKIINLNRSLLHPHTTDIFSEIIQH